MLGSHCRNRRLAARLSVAVAVAAAALVAVPTAAAPMASSPAPVTLLPPEIVRSNGADLQWSRFVDGPGAAFDRYEVHRSATSGFTPNGATLLTAIEDQDTLRFTDATAAPSRTFYYVVSVAGTTSAPLAVVTEADGLARMTLQPGPREGNSTFVQTQNTTACLTSRNNGASGYLRIGVSRSQVTHRSLLWFDTRRIPPSATVTGASLALRWTGFSNNPGTGTGVSLLPATRAWEEGTGNGSCTGAGATWLESAPGVNWTKPGGDAGAAVASTKEEDRRVAGIDTFIGTAFTSTVQRWVNGDAPNLGVLLKLTSETPPSSNCTQPCEKYWNYISDDHGTPSWRPKLVVTFRDGNRAVAPTIAVASPQPTEINRGIVRVRAAAADDRRVDAVKFSMAGRTAVDTVAPFEATFDVSGEPLETLHTLDVTATDDAGNQSTTSSQVRSWNPGPPAVALAVPQRSGDKVRGDVALSANASSAAAAIERVEFYDNDNLVGEDASAPYSVVWRSADQVRNSYDGVHRITAKAYDNSGLVSTSAPVDLVADNTAGTAYRAAFDLSSSSTDDDDALLARTARQGSGPKAHAGKPMASPPQDDGSAVVAYAASTDGDATATSTEDDASALETESGEETLLGAPCPDDATCFAVRVTNTSTLPWRGGDRELWYRWYREHDGLVVFEGTASEKFPDLPAGHSKKVPVVVRAPALPDNAEGTGYRLRFDIFDVSAQTWFAAAGNPPVDRPVHVTKDIAGGLGLERWWAYDTGEVGAGMQHLVNTATGNSLLRWTAFGSPGRGLSTEATLTYNSLEDHSKSPAGNNVSLAVSGLTRLGARLDIHPTPADAGSGHADHCWIAFTDGDGTRHVFTGVYEPPNNDPNAKGECRNWSEPAGVNLYLRKLAGTDPARRWALTRPDRVTFVFDEAGYPTSVTDRSGNTMVFELEDVAPGDDPGGHKRRVTRVTDAGGRSFAIEYYGRSDARNPHVRGRVKRVLDHSGSALEFSYYDDGNLLRLRQLRGVDVLGGTGADRVFVFTYTTSSGAEPAIPDPAKRVDPEPRTPNQSTRIYSVRDPRGAETVFSYYGPSEGAAVRWRLKARVDRLGKATTYAYNLPVRTTSVTAPLARTTTWLWDDRGRPLDQGMPDGRHVYRTWSADNRLDSVSDPTSGAADAAKAQKFVHNGNGLPTRIENQAGEVTTLEYRNSPVDGSDASLRLSDLAGVTRPRGHRWIFGLDDAGRVTSVTPPKVAAEPAAPVARLAYNPDGTVRTSTDFNGHTTTVESYDAAGLPTKVVDPTGAVTRAGYDADGLLRWVQDPNHEVPGRDPASDPARATYTTVFDYDELHQLVRVSAPKSTRFERGTLVWARQGYDANGNLVSTSVPRFGAADPGAGSATTVAYDAMDRAVAATDPAGHVARVAYDDAGRVVAASSPRGDSTPYPDDFTVFTDYDAADRVKSSTRYELSSTGTVVRTTRSHRCYEDDGDLARVVQPGADVAAVDCANPDAVARLWSTTFTYDDAHRLTATTDPEGRVMRSRYDAYGNVVEQTDAGGATVRMDYDERDRLVRRTTPFDAKAVPARALVSEWRHDAAGNVTKVIPPRAFDAAAGAEPTMFVTELAYDAAGRLVKATEPTSSLHPEPTYTHVARDANGEPTWVSLPTTVSDPSLVPIGAKTVMTRFDPGWVRSVDDPADPVVYFDYTARGGQATRTPGVADSPGELDTAKAMYWRYTDDGHLASVHDRTGQLAKYTYDADGNQQSAVDSAGLADPGQGAREVVSTYDGLGRLARTDHRRTSESSYKVTTYGYDRDGYLVSRDDDGTAATPQSVPSGASRHRFTNDRTGRVLAQLELGTSSSCGGDRRTRRAYTPQGWETERVIEVSTGTCTTNDHLNGSWSRRSRTTWGHFDNGKLRTLDTFDKDLAPVESHVLGYLDGSVYVNGNRTSDRYVLKGPGGTPCSAAACTATFRYDAKDRLVGHDDGHGGSITYAFDEPARLSEPTLRAGNLTSEVAGTAATSYTYVGTRLTTQTKGSVTKKYWYDPIGNLDCVTAATGSPSDCSPARGGPVAATLETDYGYDGLDRLAAARSFASGTLTRSASYVYDALDRVVSEADSEGSTARTTTFGYQGLTSLATSETVTTTLSGATKTEAKRYGYDSTGNRLSMARTTGGVTSTYTYAYDPHGSTSLLFDDAAATGATVKASYGYTPYGAIDDALTKGDTDRFAPLNPYRYSAKRWDIGSQTLDMGARRMGTSPARFLQADRYFGAVADLQLGTDPLTRNRYALAGGNPVGFTEVDGHRVTEDGSGGAAPAVSAPPPTTTSEPPSGGGTASTATSGCVSVSCLTTWQPPPMSGPPGDPCTGMTPVDEEGCRRLEAAVDAVSPGVVESTAETDRRLHDRYADGDPSAAARPARAKSTSSTDHDPGPSDEFFVDLFNGVAAAADAVGVGAAGVTAVAPNPATAVVGAAAAAASLGARVAATLVECSSGWDDACEAQLNRSVTTGAFQAASKFVSAFGDAAAGAFDFVTGLPGAVGDVGNWLADSPDRVGVVCRSRPSNQGPLLVGGEAGQPC